MKFWLDLFAFFFLLLQNFNGIEGGCKTILFRSKITGKALQNTVFKSGKAKDERHCRSLCFMDDRCLSCNYIPDVKSCELSESDHVLQPDNLVARPGGIYYSIENNCKCNKTDICRYNFTANTYKCECDWSNPKINCTPVCQTDANNCHSNADCTGRRSQFNCTCKTGYLGDGVNNCDDIDECTTNTHNCNANAECSNTAGSFTCTCKAGYQGNGVTCDDIDECQTKCLTNSVCTNTPGSFTCQCKSGYVIQADNCVDVNECATGVAVCDASASCTNTLGSYQCHCTAGFTGDGQTCTDIDECTMNTHNCLAIAKCTNTAGSFTCQCETGYQGDGKTTCVDINECTNGQATCSAYADCTNTPGSFNCTCKTGYVGNGFQCSTPITVKVVSGANTLFQVNQRSSMGKDADAFNFLVVNIDGSYYDSDDLVMGFDTKHDDEAVSDLKSFINDIPNNKIVLMAVHKADHMPTQTIYNLVISTLQTIGVKMTHAQIDGKLGWCLVGYKGATKSWVIEKATTSTDTTITANIDPYAA